MLILNRAQYRNFSGNVLAFSRKVSDETDNRFLGNIETAGKDSRSIGRKSFFSHSCLLQVSSD